MTTAENEEYWTAAVSWDSNNVEQMRRGARIAWWTAAAGWLCALMSTAALMLLMPLKRVEPFVVRVDNSTGVVDVVPTYTGRMQSSEAVTRYLLTHYVTVCERFNFSTAESDYQECGAFQSALRNQAWYALWNPANPASPLNIYRDGTTVRARVVSVSFFNRANGVGDLAQVRYVKARTSAGSVDEQMTHWIATVQYGYGEPAKTPQTRNWNPLGFRVIDFRPEPEVPGSSVTEAGTASPRGSSTAKGLQP